MRNINAGNILPFFKAVTHQSHRVVGNFTKPLLCRTTQLVPFQVMIPAPDNPASLTWRVVACDGTETTLSAVLTIRCIEGQSIAVITYDSEVVTAIACGVYYIEIEVDNVTVLYSDLIQVITPSSSMIELAWSNDFDFGGVVYQMGYTQRWLTQAYFDRPQIDEQRETHIDGFGNETTKYSRIVERVRFEALPIHDASIMGLMQSAQCDTVTITYLDTNTTEPVTNIRIETRAFGGNGNVPSVVLDRVPSISTGCSDGNYTLVECPTIE